MHQTYNSKFTCGKAFQLLSLLHHFKNRAQNF
jgi:hypothetical protein